MNLLGVYSKRWSIVCVCVRARMINGRRPRTMRRHEIFPIVFFFALSRKPNIDWHLELSLSKLNISRCADDRAEQKPIAIQFFFSGKISDRRPCATLSFFLSSSIHGRIIKRQLDSLLIRRFLYVMGHRFADSFVFVYPFQLNKETIIGFE